MQNSGKDGGKFMDKKIKYGKKDLFGEIWGLKAPKVPDGGNVGEMLTILVIVGIYC